MMKLYMDNGPDRKVKAVLVDGERVKSARLHASGWATVEYYNDEGTALVRPSRLKIVELEDKDNGSLWEEIG